MEHFDQRTTYVPRTTKRRLTLAQTSSKHRSELVSDEMLQLEILRILRRRDQALSVCPSEIARAMVENGWRTLMPRIRHVLIELIQAQRVIATRGARVLSEHELDGGTIRIRRGPRF